MKPWNDDLCRKTQGTAPALVSVSDGRMVAVLREMDVAEWEALLLAAPKMGRSLLAQGRIEDGEWHTEVCWEFSAECMATCREARDALKAAGVLP